MDNVAIPSSMVPNAEASPAARRIRALIQRPNITISLAWKLVGIWVSLHGTRREQRALRRTMATVATIPLTSEDDRLYLHEQACGFAKGAANWVALCDRWNEDVSPSLSESSFPFFASLGASIGRNLEDVAYEYEDVAETLALASSVEFTGAVRKDLAARGYASEAPGHGCQGAPG